MTLLERLEMTQAQIPITLFAFAVIVLIVINDHDTRGTWTTGWIFGGAAVLFIGLQLIETA